MSVLTIFPVTLREPSTVRPPIMRVFPPMFTSPPIPTPPATKSAPIVVLVDSVVFVTDVAGVVTRPVNVGDASGALKSSAVCCAVETGLDASDVLSTAERPTMVLVIPVTEPPAILSPPVPRIITFPLISINPRTYVCLSLLDADAYCNQVLSIYIY